MKMVDGCNSGHASYYKTIGKSGLFYRGKGRVGKAVINKKSIGVNWELEVHNGFSLAEL